MPDCNFKTIEIETHGCEGVVSQFYVAEERVTAEQIKMGEDEGVLALALSQEAAEMIVDRLNGQTQNMDS